MSISVPSKVFWIFGVRWCALRHFQAWHTGFFDEMNRFDALLPAQSALKERQCFFLDQ